MSAGDVILYATDEACPHRASYRTNISAATFREGEPVVLDASNELVECAVVDPPAITGIAVEPAVSRSNMMAALETSDTFRLIERWVPQNTFICRYFATDGAGTLTTPTHANAVGQLGNLYSNGTQWTFDTGAANNNCVGIDVLDASGNSLQNDLVPNTAGVYVVVRPL